MKVLFIFGTRPEAIKMAPLIHEFKKHTAINTKICITAQHREMLDQVLEFFNITPDYDLNLMSPNQTLFDITAKALKGLEGVLDTEKPDLVFVQGDTTTCFVGALAAFYKKIKVAHIEAGLRSFNKYSPFPEEINRGLTGKIADYHFAPTAKAKNNLETEGYKDNIFVVGNTVTDALFLGLDILKNTPSPQHSALFSHINFDKRVILVTGHRRESFGKPFQNLTNAILEIAQGHPDVEIVYPVHLNPNVRSVVNQTLSGVKNIHLTEPLNYADLIWLLNQSYMVLTDSGGIQEEAPALGKPVLVMRDVTERVEGIEAGTAKLVGTNREVIVTETQKLLSDASHYQTMSQAVNPYGDGTTSKQVLDILLTVEENING
ncbi:non-hydrolyzing UDP-N-acetylglucosamine 2-epimerase [Microscilla marina]|uniref:UDP-N-acetylglucosamine 2-epimerase (non-hydrolyzing) n=1 Tax=Microscilla marina ATCC 23134 TaxID=313606 RepID=A1ZU00_MICM2|nr:UDP-N-acetylglucosamine 2-epimerase (non-hydrolyzing) [Microscilla marina]EAY26113.1 UDP-N-acetylglucosamine 2-epimerase [Microscilla marina ATCC 23134]